MNGWKEWLNRKEKWNYVISRKIYRTRDHHAEQDKASSKGQILQVLTYLSTFDLKLYYDDNNNSTWMYMGDCLVEGWVGKGRWIRKDSEQ
jgi:hypothetical protein